MSKVQKIVITTCILGYFLIFQAIYTQKNIEEESQIGFCIFKKVTNFPCPSCGSTRAVLLLLKAHFVESVLKNPFGLIIVLYLIIAPILLIFDLIFKNEIIEKYYLKLENSLKQKPVFICLIVLVVLNWIWNISKNL